jgi:serine acetyltransferase
MIVLAIVVRFLTGLALLGGLLSLCCILWICLAVPVLVVLAKRMEHRGFWWSLYVLGLHAVLSPLYRGITAVPVLRATIGRLLRIAYQMLTVATGAEIPLGMRIGKGMNLAHTAGIVFHGDAVIGDYCIIGPGVIVGGDARGGVPIIGRNVLIGANVVIAGSAIVGDYATIGAGSTIIGQQIPEHALVVGNPGVVVKENYRRDYYYYPKEDGCE